jgi:hypothetical protein
MEDNSIFSVPEVLQRIEITYQVNGIVGIADSPCATSSRCMPVSMITTITHSFIQQSPSVAITKQGQPSTQ